MYACWLGPSYSCCIHRFMCNRTRLLGFINLSHHRGYRFGWWIWYRYGISHWSLAGKTPAQAASYVALGWQVGVLAAALLHPCIASTYRLARACSLSVSSSICCLVFTYRLHEPEIFSQNRLNFQPKNIKLESFKLLVKDKATTKWALV